METLTLELSAPEAAVALAVLVSFSDDDPSEAEGVVLRKFYRYSTAESLQQKLTVAGYHYPTDLPSAERTIVAALGSAPHAFKVRTLAVAWELALADGKVDQAEMHLLSRYAEALGVGLAEAKAWADAGIPEVDEGTENELEAAEQLDIGRTGVPAMPNLSPIAAGIALACWVGFSDDNPSDAEAAVLREHFDAGDVEALITLLGDIGFDYPGMLPDLHPAILHTLSQLCRNEQLKFLAIADKVARADGQVIAEEEDILKRYCEELYLGMAEVRSFFRTSVV